MQYSKRKQKKTGKPAELPARAASMPLEKALAVFLNAQEGSGHSKYTICNYRSTLVHFLMYMREEHLYETIDQIEEADVLEWMAYLRGVTTRRGKPYSSVSIQSKARFVIAFFNWLFGHKKIDVNPVAQIKQPKAEKTLIRIFTEEDLIKLDAACDRSPHGPSLTEDERKALAARDRAILWLLLSTGIRAGELCGLRFSDLDWSDGSIVVHGKGAKQRRVPFGKVARQHLDTYIQYWRGEPEDQDEFVFITLFGTNLNSTSIIQSVFKRLRCVSGIQDKRVSAHTCRHWFAVNAIKQGMPTKALKDILGHERWEMIEIYVKLAEEDLQQVYKTYSPVDRLNMHRSAKGKREKLREWRQARRRSDRPI